MKKYLYIGFFVASVILTVMTIIDSIKGAAGTSDSIFKGVLVVFVLAFYVFIQVICLFTLKPNFSLYRCGFYILHIGLVLFLTGSFIYYISGDVINVSIPVNKDTIYSEIKREAPDKNGNDTTKLGFGIGVSDFYVERYTEEDGVAGADKHYEATLMIMEGGSRDIKETPLTVNNPHRQNGWKIYLMNYDRMTESAVQLSFKYDPGEYISLTGIWFSVVGCFVMCLLRKKNGGVAV